MYYAIFCPTLNKDFNNNNNNSHQLAKFCGHRHCGNGDLMILGSQDHVIEGSRNFMDRSPSRLNYCLARFGGHRHCGSKDIF